MLCEKTPSPEQAAEMAVSAKADLRAYTRLKHALAEQARALREVFKRHGNQNANQDCDALIAKLAQDRFTLAMLGQFKRGKSSLLNAIAGRELLPVGLLPLTSAITVLRFGARERLLVERKNWSFTEEVPVAELSNYVTEKGNPGNVKQVVAAYLELPLPFLRPGVEFVDTPGIGSAIEANTATTRQFLPQCDAALFVTSVEAALTGAEMEFLREVREHVHKIFFVMNKTDLLASDALDEVLDFATRAISAQTSAESVRIFRISARLGLAGKLKNDSIASSQSGLMELESSLSRFLASEKTPVFLAAVADKLTRLLEYALHEASAEHIHAPDAHDWERGRVAIESIRQRLAVIIAAIDTVGESHALENQSDTNPFLDATTSTPLPSVGSPTRSAQPSDITHDLESRGCAICQHLANVTANFFTHWQYALYVDASVQNDFATGRGFCPQHTWQLEAISSPVGVAVGQVRLIENFARALAHASQTPSARQSLKSLIQDQQHCRVCQLVRKAEADYLERLSAYIQDMKGRENYARAHGPCLRHLALLASNCVDDELVKFLLSTAARHFEEMAEEMQGFSLKSEGLCRHLLNANEQDAHWRAITHIAGMRNFCFPPEE